MMKLKLHLEQVTKPIFQKKRQLLYKIVFEWKKIIGEFYSDKILPLDIIYPTLSSVQGTIVLLCHNPSLSMEVQMMNPVIVERLNTYFGYQAINKVKTKFSY